MLSQSCQIPVNVRKIDHRWAIWSDDCPWHKAQTIAFGTSLSEAIRKFEALKK